MTDKTLRGYMEWNYQFLNGQRRIRSVLHKWAQYSTMPVFNMLALNNVTGHPIVCAHYGVGRDRSSSEAGGAQAPLPLRIPWSPTRASPNLKCTQYNVERASVLQQFSSVLPKVFSGSVPGSGHTYL